MAASGAESARNGPATAEPAGRLPITSSSTAHHQIRRMSGLVPSLKFVISRIIRIIARTDGSTLDMPDEAPMQNSTVVRRFPDGHRPFPNSASWPSPNVAPTPCAMQAEPFSGRSREAAVPSRRPKLMPSRTSRHPGLRFHKSAKNVHDGGKYAQIVVSTASWRKNGG